MKVSNTAQRLKEIMDSRNLRQIDILNLTKPYCEKYGVKMNKSDISQYVAGKNEPAQDKLIVLGAALNVNEAWLMGFDVPMKKIDTDFTKKENLNNIKNFVDYIANANNLNDEVKRETKKQKAIIASMIAYFSMLNEDGKKEAVNRIEELTHIPKYKKEESDDPLLSQISEIRKELSNTLLNLSAAHERTDIEVTDEMRKHDDELMDGEW